MIKKEFIPYELALELKQLGFDEPCFGEWQNLKIGKNLIVDEEDRIYDVPVLGADIKAPTYSQAFRWFREKHNLKSWIQEHTSDTFIYEIRPHVLSDYKQGETYVYTNYEKVELACLKKLIEIVKGGNK